MKKLLLSLHILSKQKLLNFLIVFEMALVLFVVGVSLNRFDYITKNDNFIAQSSLQNSLNFSAPYFGVDDTTGKLLKETLSQVNKITQQYDYIKGISDINEYTIKSDTLQTSLFIYDNYSSKKLKFLLSSGEWVHLPTEKKDGRIPVIALSNGEISFRKGDIINGKVEAYQGRSDNPKQFDAELEVIGITTDAAQSLLLPEGSRNFTGNLGNLFTGVMQGKTIFLAAAIEQWTASKPSHIENVIIYIKPNTPTDKIRALQQELSEYGQVDLISDMQQNSKEITNERIRKDFPTFAILTIAALTGFISVSILNIHQQLRRISIWLMNGMSYKQVSIIYGLYNTILLSLSFIIYYGLMTLSYYLDGRGHYYFYFIRVNHIIISSLILATIAILVTLGCMGIIKRKGLFEYYYD